MDLSWLAISDDNETRVAQSMAIVRQMPMNILGNGIGVVIGVVTLSNYYDSSKALLPLLPLLLFVVPMFLSWLRLKDRPRPEHVSRRRIRIIIGFSTALGFALGGLIIYYLSPLPIAPVAFLVTASAFLAVGAVTAISVIPMACLGYALPIMAADIFVSLNVNDPLGISLVFMTLLMLLGQIWFLYNNWQAFTQEIDAHRAAMRDTQELLLESQRLSRTGFVLVDAKNGRAIWSDSLFEIRKVPRREWFADEESLAFIDPRDIEAYNRAKAEGIRSRSPFRCERRFRHPDGSERWESLIGLPKFDGTGQLDTILIVVQDITELRKGQIELGRAHARLELALNTIDDMFLLWDSDHKLIYVNARAQAIAGKLGHRLDMGLAFADFMGMIWKSAPAINQTVERDEFVTSQLYRLVNDMPPLVVDLGDGLWLKLRERITVNGEIAVVGTDISNAKQNEEELTAHNLVLKHEIVALERQLAQLRGNGSAVIRPTIGRIA